MELVAKKLAITMNLTAYDNFARFLLYATSSLDLWNKNICKYSTFKSTKASLRKCYNVLGVPYDSDQETVRQAFVKLVKRFHPDSGSPEADVSRFHEIETAYRELQEKFSNDRWKQNEGVGEYGLYYVEKHAVHKNVQEQDIEHTAPQHRQYLSFGGYGVGTPSQRQRQYQKMRAETASNSVIGYRVKKIQADTRCTEEQALVVKDKKAAKKIKTRYGFERLVEDLIQESMARGDFDNLSGQGKPLKIDHHNPYVDLVTHKLNQVMIENGFKPEWISLQKEIAEESDDIKLELTRVRSTLGMLPLNEEDELIWDHTIVNLLPKVKKLNSKINKFNLVVPLLRKQMFQFDITKEAKKILNEYKPKCEINAEDENAHINDKKKNESEPSSFIKFLTSIF